jgi:hypothetical protein
MYKRVVIAVMLIGVIGCTALKNRFGTGEDTPELKATRAECRAMAKKEAISKYESEISQQEHTRIAFEACMEKKGYNRLGKKIK